MTKTVEFLRNKVFYLATVDENGQPKVRPFGAVGLMDGRVYICTNSTKNVSKQMKVNPSIEISATGENMDWIRITAEVVFDDNADAKKMMFEQNQNLSDIYSTDEQKQLFEVFYLKNATSQIFGIDGTIKATEKS